MTAGAPAGELDVAIVGAGAAGTYVAHRLGQARPDWRIVILKRTDRVGGRLRSVAVPSIDHPIELGGMRYVTSHHHVTNLVAELGLRTHPFDQTGGHERSFLRGRFADGPTDPRGGIPYELAESERGRSAAELTLEAFERIIPNATSLNHADSRRPAQTAASSIGASQTGRSARRTRRSAARTARRTSAKRSAMTRPRARVQRRRRHRVRARRRPPERRGEMGQRSRLGSRTMR